MLSSVERSGTEKILLSDEARNLKGDLRILMDWRGFLKYQRNT